MNNTQEKAATDNNGSYDQENPDIRYSLSDYSEADRFDLIKVIKPYVGRSMNKSDADYLKFFKDKNLPVYTEADAHEIAATAMYENRSDSRRAAAQKRDKWLYDNLPLYAAAAIQENRDGLIRNLPFNCVAYCIIRHQQRTFNMSCSVFFSGASINQKHWFLRLFPLFFRYRANGAAVMTSSADSPNVKEKHHEPQLLQ